MRKRVRRLQVTTLVVAGVLGLGAVQAQAKSALRTSASPAVLAVSPAPLDLTATQAASIGGGAVAPDETTFQYGGKLITAAEASQRHLSCFEKDLVTRCYGSEALLDRAEALAFGGAVSASRKRTRARAANHGGQLMSLYENSGFNSPSSGWRVDTSTSCTWFNLTGGYNDNSSSWRTGSHTGYVSVDNGGSGELLGFPAYNDIPHLSAYTYYKCTILGCGQYGNWNDNASSRKRLGC